MKQNLLKTMLVSVVMLAGSMGGVMAQTVLYERGTSDETAWTDDNLSDFKASTGSLVKTEYGAQITTSNTAVNVTKSIAPSKDVILNVEAVWLGMSNTGRYWSNSTASYFKFGNIYILENDQENKAPSAYSLNGFSATNYTNFTGPTGVRTYDPATRPFYVIKIEINTATNTLNYLKVYSSADESKELLSLANQPLANADYTTIAFGYFRGGSVNTNQVEILKSIKVTETAQTVATADYSIKYVDEAGNEIKASEKRTAEVGASVSLLDTDKGSFFNADNTQKYIYASDDANDAAVASDGTTVVTVKFRKAEKFGYTVNAISNGNVLQQIATGTNFEGESFKVPYGKYILKDGILYNGVQGNKDTGWYQQPVSLTENNQVINVEYNESAIKNVAFWSEAEDISTLTASNEAAAPVRCSQGKGAYASTDAVITSLAAGKYKMHVGVYGNAGTTFVFKNGENEIFSAATTGNAEELTSDEAFDIANQSEIVLSTAGNGGISPKLIDYIIIEKVAENVAVTSAKYATYVPTCNVVAPSDVKVYTAKADVANKVVNLTEIPADAVIPAGTPVIVGAAAGTYTFAASADDETIIGENDLKAATPETKGNGSIYVLVEQNNQAVFAPVKEGVEVPVGKAYMEINAANKAAYYSIGGGNGTTGINNVDAKTADDGAYYTLQGVKVSKAATKGIYIHNGKKVIK